MMSARVQFKLWFHFASCTVFLSSGLSQPQVEGADFQRDAMDQPFRRAPMAESPRSIVIPLATNLHLAFDARLLRTHTLWSGPGLNLRGPPYAGAERIS